MRGAPPDWDSRLRAAGLRSTSQRRAVLAALDELGHATVDELAAHVQRELPDLSLSTVYRTVEALDEVGLVTHAHLRHGTPTYHRVDDDPHVHLVCRRCEQVESLPASVAEHFVEAVREASGFEADITHLALHGVCGRCRARMAATE
jgi:Fur family ferric uptake transcriptional regulator